MPSRFKLMAARAAALLVLGCGSEDSTRSAAEPPGIERDDRTRDDCKTAADCPVGQACVVAREGEFERGRCITPARTEPPTVSTASGSGGPVTATPNGDDVQPSPDRPQPPIALPKCSVTDSAATDPWLTSAPWIGSQSPATSSALDDGPGASARFRYVIAMRYAPSTKTLWINDSRIRSIDESGVVTTRSSDGFNWGPSYANLGVDSAGNGYAYAYGGPIKKFPASGGAPTKVAVTLPADCNFMAMTVGLDDHVYVACAYSNNKGGLAGGPQGGAIVDVTLGSTIVAQSPLISVPTDLAADASGHIWVADPNHQQVHRFDVGSGAREDLYPNSGCTPFAIAVDATGTFFAHSGQYSLNGARRARFVRPFAYGLAASIEHVFVPECTYTDGAGWGCAIHRAAR